MYKTPTMFAIVLTLYLAASALAAAPKSAAALPKIMSTDQVMEQDKFWKEQIRAFSNCVVKATQAEAFNHQTTLELYRATYTVSRKDCWMYNHLATSRLCELANDIHPESILGSVCSGGAQEMTKYLDGSLNRTIVRGIEIFDKQRAEKGLPPRPSIDR